MSASAIRGVDTLGLQPHHARDHRRPRQLLARQLLEREVARSPATWTLPDGVTARDPGRVHRHRQGQRHPRRLRRRGSRSAPPPGRTATTSTAVTRSVLFSVVLDPGVDATGTNEPPVAEFTTGCAGLTCEFDASLSFDLDDDDVLTYRGTSATARPAPASTRSTPTPTAGTRTVTLTVDDGHGHHPTTATGTATPLRRTQPPGHTGAGARTRRAPTSRRSPTVRSGTSRWSATRAYVAGDVHLDPAAQQRRDVAQAELAAYNWNTGQVDTGFRPTFTSGARRRGRGLAGRHQALRLRRLRHGQRASTKQGDRPDQPDDRRARSTSFTANANGKVIELAVTNTTVYAGGRFTTVNNVPRGALAALDAHHRRGADRLRQQHHRRHRHQRRAGRAAAEADPRRGPAARGAHRPPGQRPEPVRRRRSSTPAPTS